MQAQKKKKKKAQKSVTLSHLFALKGQCISERADAHIAECDSGEMRLEISGDFPVCLLTVPPQPCDVLWPL